MAGVLLGWRFQRGRLLLALLALALADRALLWLAPLDADVPFAGPVVVRAVAILLPTTLAGLAFVGERGVLTSVGLRRLAMLAVQSAVVLTLWVLSAAYPENTARVLDLALLPPPMLAWLPLGQPAALVALVAIAVLVARTLWRADAESRGLLWATVGSVIALSAGPADGRATLYLASAGLVLVVAMVESAYALAYHDELTGLPARRALNDALQRMGGMYTVAMVDIDHFKRFNDTHGHDVGDQVLRMVAGRLARVTGGGRAFRYGGEEFAVLFPGKTAEDSAPHLEALRVAVAGASFTLRAPDRPKRKPKSPRARGAGVIKRLAVTVSVGAAQARGSALPEEVVKAADRALYRAKEGGRNRVEV
jgi:diguanylate cyclase (GGDEF)-like protein